MQYYIIDQVSDQVQTEDLLQTKTSPWAPILNLTNLLYPMINDDHVPFTFEVVGVHVVSVLVWIDLDVNCLFAGAQGHSGNFSF